MRVCVPQVCQIGVVGWLRGQFLPLYLMCVQLVDERIEVLPNGGSQLPRA